MFNPLSSTANIFSKMIIQPEAGPVKGGFQSKYLNKFKTVNGNKYQLHATKGWRKIGKSKERKYND